MRPGWMSPSHRSIKKMLPPIGGDHYTPRKKKEIEIDRLIGKCNSAQEFIGKSSELLKMKPRLNGLDDNLVQENVFSKSIKFKLDKEKVKNNIKNYVENQYSEKLKKIKSVVSFEEPRSNELLSPEDVQNKDAARFFSLNKRDFGNVSGVSQIKYEKPFKPKRTFQRVNPVETVLTSIKSIMQPQEKKEHDLPQGSLYTKDDLMKLIKQKSPKNRIIENELVKLWPGLDEKRSKEQKALQLKVQKLVRYKNEVSSLPILSPSSKSTRRNDAKEEPLS